MTTRKKTADVAAPAAADVAPAIGHNVGTAVDAKVKALMPVLLAMATADSDAADVREARKGSYTTATRIAADCTPEVWNATAAELDRRQTCNVDGLATKIGLAPNAKEKGKFKLCRSWTAAKYVLTKAHELHVPMLDKGGKPLPFGKIRQEVLGKVAAAAAAKLEGAAKVRAQIEATLATIATAAKGMREDRLDATLAALEELNASLVTLGHADADKPADLAAAA